MKKYPNVNKKSQQLGMHYGTACYRLRRSIFFQLIQECNRDTCSICGLLITSVKELSIHHNIAWLDNNPSLFWDLDNISFTHKKCNYQNKRHHGACKGGVKGEQCSWAKLTALKVQIIRKLAATGRTHKSLGEEFGVSRQTITDVVSRRHWKHIT